MLRLKRADYDILVTSATQLMVYSDRTLWQHCRERRGHVQGLSSYTNCVSLIADDRYQLGEQIEENSRRRYEQTKVIIGPFFCVQQLSIRHNATCRAASGSLKLRPKIMHSLQAPASCTSQSSRILPILCSNSQQLRCSFFLSSFKIPVQFIGSDKQNIARLC